MLTASDLHAEFGDNTIFEGLSLTLSGDRRIGLVGPNGAGKTTLLRLLAGADVPERGQEPEVLEDEQVIVEPAIRVRHGRAERRLEGQQDGHQPERDQQPGADPPDQERYPRNSVSTATAANSRLR